jgi:hypothetical protein
MARNNCRSLAVMPTLSHGPEHDAINQGRADAQANKPRRILGGELAEFQAQYDIGYKKELRKRLTSTVLIKTCDVPAGTRCGDVACELLRNQAGRITILEDLESAVNACKADGMSDAQVLSIIAKVLGA